MFSFLKRRKNKGKKDENAKTKQSKDESRESARAKPVVRISKDHAADERDEVEEDEVEEEQEEEKERTGVTFGSVNKNPPMSTLGADDLRLVVLQTGEGSVRAGFPPLDAPQAVFPTVVGRPRKDQPPGIAAPVKDVFIGEEAITKRTLLLNSPIQRGVIKNWDDIEKLWEHTFIDELRCSTDECVVLLTEPPLMPGADRERIVQIMMETFGFPAVFLALEQTLSLYQSGRNTGIVLDSGEGMTYCVPIFEGHAIQHAINRIELGGKDMTQHLSHLLRDQSGFSSSIIPDREIIRDIKEKMCYVALDFDEELKSGGRTTGNTYDAPNCRSLTLGDLRFQLPEGLFQPSTCLGVEGVGVHQMVVDSISKCDVTLRSELFGNVLLAGGNTLFSGVEDRLTNEIISLSPERTKVKVIAPQARRISTWLGGSTVATLPAFKKMWISRDDYDEEGPSIVHRKCF